MTPALALLALACGAFQFGLSLALRPDLRRIATLKTADDSGDPTPGLRMDFERVGRAILRLAGGSRQDLRPPASALTARSIGAAAVFGGGLLPMSPLLAVVGAFAGWGWPRLVHARSERVRAAALAGDLPEVVDLLTLALGAGLNVALAVDAVGRRGVGPLAAHMAAAAEATRRGRRLADALDDLTAPCGEQVRPLISLLASGERYGVPLGESLDRLAVDVRAARRRQAEEAARRLPVKMLFPLVVCILPAFALLTLGPLLLTSFRDLGW
jgi:tight adherence protein C